MFYMPSYIPDGYTQPGYCQGREMLHGPLRFTFRPALIKEVSDHFSKTDKMRSGGESDVASALFLKPRVREWDLRSATGDVLPIEAPHMLKMSRLLFQQLLGIVCGLQATDLDPEWSEEQQLAIVEVHLSAITAGRSVGAQQQEADAKNC